MKLKLTLASNEIEDFAMEILIDANATFLDLHRLILKSCRYEEEAQQRFYICDEEWRPEQRIFLEEEGNAKSDEDIYLMEDTILGDFLEDEGQRLAYRFDPENKRIFLLELTETLFGERQEQPIVKRRAGMPPTQRLEEETAEAPTQTDTTELDESFYGDEGFEEEEFDEEGFDILEN